MIRLIFVIILFLIYGNFSFVINDIVILSLINIAFYTILKEKNIKIIDVLIFVLSTFVVEVFVGLPILIGIVVLFMPLLLLNYLINNYNFALFINDREYTLNSETTKISQSNSLVHAL